MNKVCHFMISMSECFDLLGLKMGLSFGFEKQNKFGRTNKSVNVYELFTTCQVCSLEGRKETVSCCVSRPVSGIIS